MASKAELQIVSDYVSEFAETLDECKGLLPIDVSNVLSKLDDGILLGRLTQEGLAKDDLPNRAIKSPVKDDADKKANRAAIAAAINKKTELSLDPNDREGFAKKVVMLHLQQNINLIESIAIIRTLKDGEGLDFLLKMSPKEILQRWVNYHLTAAGVPLPDNKDEHIKDLHKDLTTTYIFKLLKHLDKTKGLITDSEPSTQAVLRAAEILEVNRFVSAESIEGKWGLVNEAFLSHVFNSHPGLYLPTEEEMDHILKEIRALQQRLKDCMESSKTMEARVKQIKDEMSSLMKKKDDIVNESEFHRLMKQLEELQAQRAAFDDEMNKIFAEQKAQIEALQRRLDELNAINANMQEQVKGQGEEVANLNKKLAEATQLSNDKSRAIQEHAEKLRAKMVEWGSAKQLEENPNITIAHSEDDKEQLDHCILAQNKMIKAYKDSLVSVNQRFDRQKADAKRRIEEINALVAEYLGSGEVSAGDAIANMKRLLELMIEKCKKQSKQIATYDLTIEKMDDLSLLMREKIKVYAEKSQKKKSIFSSKSSKPQD